MRQSIVLVAVALAVLVCCAEGRTLDKRDAYDANLDPALQEVDSDENVRDKRHQDIKFGVKNALLGFVFNPSTTKPVPTTTTTRKPTTTEDIVIFEKNRPVSLDVPDKLFGSSFTLITNLSETVGDFMINSAERAQRLLESMRPFLWKIFGKKGLVIEVTTNKPVFSDASSNGVRR